MKKLLLSFLLFEIAFLAYSQADNEIQVYASPTISYKWTIVELHTNYTFKGMRNLPDPKSARWLNETLEITHGFAKNFEIGVYLFTSFDPSGKYQYLGNQIRPRVTVPENWNWPVGASLSAEFGFFRPDASADFFWQGEIRPIVDKSTGNWYFSLNPNIDFNFGEDQQWGITPQFKTVYTIKEKVGVGLEYYGALGTFQRIAPIEEQEHLLGPMIDVYVHPKWEINGGFLFGLTRDSNQQIVKLLLGRRFGK